MEQNKPVKTICYVAGHSGGHIIPCLTLAKQVKHADPHASIIFFSSNGIIDTTILAENTIVNRHIPLSLSHKRSAIYLPLLGMRLIWATVYSFVMLLRYKPSRIISTGGVVAVPVSMAGWLLRIPIDLYELNAIPGKAIRLIAPLAHTIYVCFSRTQSYFSRNNCVPTRYPIRFDSNSAYTSLPSFAPHRTTLFVQGGSQGSQCINQQIKQLIESYPTLQDTIQLIHQTGADKSIDWSIFYKQYSIPAHVFPYEHDMAPYYQQADLIISRAGAGALFEAYHFKKPCLIIPLETRHNTHQLDNAQAMATEHPELFTIIRQKEEVPEKLYEKIRSHILTYPKER